MDVVVSADGRPESAESCGARAELRQLVGRLVSLAEEEDLAGISVRRDGLKIGILRAPVVFEDSRSGTASSPEPEPSTHTIRSQFVGVFHRHGEADKEPIVQPGEHIEKGAPLGCVESMRVMNVVVADAAGELLHYSALEGEIVEYGQPIAVVKVDL